MFDSNRVENLICTGFTVALIAVLVWVTAHAGLMPWQS